LFVQKPTLAYNISVIQYKEHTLIYVNAMSLTLTHNGQLNKVKHHLMRSTHQNTET